MTIIYSMVNLIFLLVFLVSVFGICLIIKKKIPALVELSAVNAERGVLKKKLSDWMQKSREAAKKIPSELFLQKVLSKIRVLTLRLENKTGDWLSRLRQRSLQKKNNLSSDYWQKLKNNKK